MCACNNNIKFGQEQSLSEPCGISGAARASCLFILLPLPLHLLLLSSPLTLFYSSLSIIDGESNEVDCS